MPPSHKHNRKKKNVTRGTAASNSTSTASTTSSSVRNKTKKESYDYLKASGVLTEILEKDLHSKIVLIQRGNT